MMKQPRQARTGLPLFLALGLCLSLVAGCSRPATEAAPSTGFTSSELLSASQLAFDRGDFARARSGFQQLVDAYPDSPEAPAALIGLGDALVRLFLFTEARQAYALVSARFPSSPQASSVGLRIGDAYIAQFKFLNADEEGLAAIGVIADDARAALELAVAAYDAVAAADPQLAAQALFKKGDALFLAGDFDGSAAALSLVGTADAQARQGLALIKAQRFAEARAVLDPVSTSSPAAAAPAVVPALGGGIPDKLVLQIRAKLEERPPDPSGAVRVELGLIDLLAAPVDLARAEAFFRASLTVEKGQSQDAGLFFLGESLRLQGKPDAAVEQYQVAVAQFPLSSFAALAQLEVVKLLRDQLAAAPDPSVADPALFGVATEAVRKLFEVSRAGLTAANTDVLEALELFLKRGDPLPPLIVKSRQLPRATVGIPFSTRPPVLGGQPPFTFSISRGALPAGLELDAASGRIRGAATGAGVSSFDLTVRDAAGAGDTRPFQVLAQAITYRSPGVLPDGVVGQPYPLTRVEVVGGTPPYGFFVAEGALPGGLALDPGSGQLAGAIAGSAGRFAFTIGVRDATGTAAFQLASLTARSVTAPLVAPQFHSPGTGGEVLDLGFQALRLFETDALFSGDGNDLVAACSGARFLAVGRVGPSDPPAFTKQVAVRTPWFRMVAASGTTPGSTADDLVLFGIATDGQVSRVAIGPGPGGQGPDLLPPGEQGLQLARTPDGRVLVLTTRALRVLDSAGTPLTAPISLGTTNAGPSPLGARRYLPVGGALVATDAEALVSPGLDAPFLGRVRLSTREVTRVPVPRGTTSIALTPDGARAIATHVSEGVATIVDLSTLATTSVDTGVFPLKVVAPSAGLAVVANFLSGDVTLVDLANPLASTQAPVGVEPVDVAAGVAAGRAFAVTADSGSDTLTFLELPGGALAARFPAAFNLPARIAIALGGERLAAALFNTARIPLLQPAALMAAGHVAIDARDLPAATVGVPFAAPALAARGGTPPVVFSQANGREVAPGVRIAPDGTIAGTPLEAGVFRFSAVATDAAGRESIQRLSLRVLPPPGTRLGFLTNTALPGGEVGLSYPPTQLGVVGLTPPLTFQLIEAPPFLALDGGGRLAGLPLEAGEFPVTVEARDAAGGVARRSYVIPVRQSVRRTATDTPAAPIPDGTGMLERSVALAGAGVAVTADLTVDIDHPFTGDLTISLITPSGDEVPVRAADGLPGAGIRRTFLRIPLPRPVPIAGVWRLRIRDLVLGDAGQLATWTLDVEAAFSVALDALRTGSVNQPYGGGTVELPLVGGALPISGPTLVSGALPPGITIRLSADQTRILVEGTPIVAGRFDATVELRDGAAARARARLVIPVLDVAPSGPNPPSTPTDVYRLAPAARTLQLAVHPDARTVFVHAAGEGGAMDDFLHVLDVPSRSLRSFATFQDPGSVRADQPSGIAVSADGRFLFQSFLPTLQGTVFQATLRKTRIADRSTVFEIPSQTGTAAVLRPDEALLLTTGPLLATVHDPISGASATVGGLGEPDFVTSLGTGSGFFVFSPGVGGSDPMRALDTSNFPGPLPAPVDMPQVPIGTGAAVQVDPLLIFRCVYVNAATSFAVPGGRIRRVDFASGDPAASPVFDFPASSSLYPGGIALTPDSRYLYAPHAVPAGAGRFTGGVAIFDTTSPATPPVLVELGGPAGRIVVSPDNRRVFATVPSLERLVVIE